MYIQGRPCQLIVHLERGFTLLEGGLGQTAKAIWTFAFDKLKGSADDGHRLLYLDFGGEDAEIVSKIFFFPYFPFDLFLTFLLTVCKY